MDNILEIIKAGDTEGLKKHLNVYPRALDVQTEEGSWALHEVMRTGNLEMARFVVEYGIVNLNLLDNEGNTVLHYAVESGNLALITYLTERVDSPVTQANRLGETPFDKSIRLGKREVTAYFEKRLGASAEELYHNPIRRGMNPDPSIVRVGEDYYMVNSSFMYFPCIPVSHSRDLIHWEVIGYAITDSEWAGLRGLEGGRGYWAPDISYYEGRFYITATCRYNDDDRPQRLQMVTSAERPEGPYEKPVFLDEDGIDPSIFTDLDGRRYMLLNRGARIFEISPDGSRILSEPKLLWYGQNKKASEGPHMLYKDGYYYLFMAEGGTGQGHRITVARSKTLMGVYESCPYNPILRQWEPNLQLQCCGHGMPVETPTGEWYMVYLCNRPGTAGYALLGRETALDPITWTADGWPLVNALRGPSDLQKKPKHTALTNNDYAKRCAGELGLWSTWATIRGAEPDTFRQEDDAILIRGNGKDLNVVDYGSALLRHQQSFFFEMSCKVQVLEPEGTPGLCGGDWDAGLTCYYDENSYLKLALCRRCGKYGILAAEYVDDRYITEQFIACPGDASFVTLRIVTDNLQRSLYFKTDDGDWELAAQLDKTAYLSSEGLNKGKRFTGASAGIYVNGKAEGRFTDFTWKETDKKNP